MSPVATPALLHLGARVRIDVAHQRLWRDGAPVRLRPKAWQVLAWLLQRPGELATTDALLDGLWPGQDVSPKTLANLVSELRAALGDDGLPPQFLQTVHRRGYRLLLQAVPGRPAATDGTPSAAPTTAVTGDRPLTGADATAQPLQRGADAAAAQPVWVGRGAELVRLELLLGRALDGQRQLALVAGDPGVGKTALLDRFIALAGRTRAVAARGACLEQTSAREPFAPVLALLADLCSGPLAGQTSAALRRCAPTWLVQLPWLVPPHELPELRKGLAGMGLGRMLREFGALLQALTSHTPLLLVIEDLHWADPATIDLLQQLASARSPASVLLLASYQPALAAQTGHPVVGLATRLAAQGQAAALALAPLDAGEVAAWIAGRFGDPALAEALGAWARQQSTGIPLYLDAALNHLVDTGHLACRQDRWQLVEPPVHEALAEPLRRLIAARFARLPADALQVLEAASVVGMQVPAQLLAAALDRDLAAVEQACSALAQRGEFVQADTPVHWPDGSQGGVLRFTHDIYRRALYEGLAPGLRQLLHRRVAERLEAGWAGSEVQLAQVAGQLAGAYAEAGMPEATARVLEVTAQVAAQRLAYGATIDALQACLRQLALMPASPARHATEIRVQLMLGNISLNHHGLTDPRTLPAFERAMHLARRTGALREQIRAQLGATVVHVAAFRPEAAQALAHDTVALAEAGQPTLAAVAHHYAGFCEALLGHLAQARQHHEQALRLTPDPVVPLYTDVPSGVQVHLGRVLCWMGLVDEGLASIDAGLMRSRAVSVPADLVQKLYWAADTCRLLGLDRAEDMLAETAEKAELFDLPGLRAAARMGLACTPAPAARDTDRIEALAHDYCRPGDHQALLMTSLALTEAHLTQGRPLAAQAAWARGRAVTPAGALFEPELLRLQGGLVIAQGRPVQEAEACLRAGLALAERQQAHWHAQRCADSLATLPRG